ncbi:MAG: aminotransferase class I/II-fold pyridoxal phosphate-dependent enzyme [Thermoanaerobaculia bacterium]
MDFEGFETICVHSDGKGDEKSGAVITPIYQTSIFKFPSAEEGSRRFLTGKGYIYTRLKNPTVEQLEKTLSKLEKGEVGLATATGMAAVSTLYFSLLSKGDHIIGTDCLYAPSRVIMEKEFSRFGVESSFIDTSNLKLVEKAVKKNTKLIYIETPANPTLKMTDIEKCAEIAHKNGAYLAVDNTFSSPILQNPIDFGADIVLHSLTKYINGHSDALGGVLIFKDKDLGERVRKVLLNLGGTMDPHQAWLILRGVKTLPLRVLKAQENAKKIASFLEKQRAVEKVFYPSLKSFPQRALAKKQMKGPGAMISFILKGGYEAGVKLMNNLRVPALAVSLGGIESLIQHPASMTHSGLSDKQREEAGISNGLVRLSVGCEDVNDLIEDLERGLSLCL